MTIACALCVGATPEAYLAAALAAIAPVVDELAVNDNSGLARSENVATIEASAFGMRPIVVRSHPFLDFADMRNRAFADLSSLPLRPDWVLFLDADEVHGEQLRYVAREILPYVGAHIGQIDAYTYHFFGTFGWITDIARRMMFYRYDPALRWENAVHEKLVGLRGEALVLPYIYHHYGNVSEPALLARKHGAYYALGNRVPEPVSEGRATVEIFAAGAAKVRPYRGDHPLVARATLASITQRCATTFADIDARFAAARNGSLRTRVATSAQAINETLRVQLRRAEHPRLFRAGTRAR